MSSLIMRKGEKSKWKGWAKERGDTVLLEPPKTGGNGDGSKDVCIIDGRTLRELQYGGLLFSLLNKSQHHLLRKNQGYIYRKLQLSLQYFIS